MTSALEGWVSLGQPLFAGLPSPHGPVGVRTETAGEAPPIRVTRLSASVHAGTHIDAARHFVPNGRTIDQYEPWRFVGRGVVLDLARDGACAVGEQEVGSALPEIEEDDIVLLSFGHARRWGTPEYESHPYLAADVADLLVERGIRMLGVDAPTPEMPAALRGPDYDFPLHRRLLGADIPIIENLGPGLAHLAGQRVIVAAFPVVIAGSDGAYTHPIAIVDAPPIHEALTHVGSSHG